MNPFFFGASTQALYGVYHHPNKQSIRDEAILLCPPFGQEYMRSHRANRQLASSLAKQGFHVLRFDYRGTGDSSANIEDVNINDWLEDIETAIDELKETAGTRTVHLIGLRLGGLLASTASLNAKLKVKKMVLWDPIISGQSYDNELQEELNKTNSSKCNLIDSLGTLHFNGFPLSKNMRNDLLAINLSDQKPTARKIYHIVSSESENADTLRNSWSDTPGYQYDFVQAPGDWNHVDESGGIMLPQPILQAITAWMIK